ncbi:MAG: hypothetical protein BGO49_08305 [Planctomycetales bacterium 71-10]|nr:MAG: hypothetical protein BGO49_08305 [Planctomycetales bacterium 71-10]
MLLVVSAVGLVTGLLLPSYLDPRRQPTPEIPPSPPEEAYRIYLPSGWSMVRPPSWEVILEDKADGSGGSFLFFIPPLAGSPLLKVEWSKAEPTTESEGVEVSFQGRPAQLVSEYEAPRPSFSLGSDRREANRIARHGCLRTTLIARRDDRWLSIYYRIYAASPAVPDVMWKFFETVRAPSDAAKQSF